MTRPLLTLAALLLTTPALALDFTDDDNDGYTSDVDCDDTDPTIYPDATEICDDGIDQDCDTVDEPCPDPDYDQDGDGHETPEDCDDTNGAVHPGADEVCDGIDNDCDDLVDDEDPDFMPPPTTEECTGVPPEDSDGDGVFTPDDCDDTDPTIYPGHPELCDDVDHDCDGQPVPDIDSSGPAYRDLDGDGYGDPASELIICGEAPSGWTWTADDCDDADESINPDATEICDDGIDNDCDGADEPCPDPDDDADGDGYTDSDDCDDTDPAIYPGAEEVCDDGIDQDCDGVDEPCPDPIDSGDTSQTFPEDDGGGAGCVGAGTGSMYASLFLPLLLLRRRRS